MTGLKKSLVVVCLVHKTVNGLLYYGLLLGCDRLEYWRVIAHEVAKVSNDMTCNVTSLYGALVHILIEGGWC